MAYTYPQRPPLRRTGPHLPTSSPTLAAPPPPAEPAAPAPSTGPQPLTLAQVLQPDHPSLKDDVPEKWTIPYITNWATQFDEVIQESAAAIAKPPAPPKSNSKKLVQSATASRCSRSPSFPFAACSNWWPSGPPWPVDWPYSAAEDPLTTYSNTSAHYTEHYPTYTPPRQIHRTS